MLPGAASIKACSLQNLTSFLSRPVREEKGSKGTLMEVPDHKNTKKKKHSLLAKEEQMQFSLNH